jgi:hypothetical protein
MLQFELASQVARMNASTLGSLEVLDGHVIYELTVR